MGKRKIRVNELIKREISEILHTRFRSDATYITITDVDVSPDLRNGSVYYSVLGDENRKLEVKEFLRSVREEIARELPRRVVLKYFPKLTYRLDESMEKGHRVLEILNALESEDEPVE